MSFSPRFPHRSRGFVLKSALVMALLGSAAVGAGATAVAQHGFGGWHHGGMGMAALSDPATMDRLLQHVYIEVGATDAQKAQLEPLLKTASADLIVLCKGLHAGHGETLKLLTAERIDRAALEAARSEHVQAMDQASRRIVQLIGDVGDVLTPDQRKALAARIAEHHGITLQ
jgi:Spy/CpxP family protein refolding chaperone